ncbi:hypothetical protein CDAR_227531 [Caerostris darwini]|uniref:Uncharacterized protein n=1 Tax=Caerostris darwini TaxID=1538125 RepID=A0AAV4UM11_9ARAC|nr:hypothetical protein CDAR_227531 [Caerostris darwini]
MKLPPQSWGPRVDNQFPFINCDVQSNGAEIYGSSDSLRPSPSTWFPPSSPQRSFNYRLLEGVCSIRPKRSVCVVQGSRLSKGDDFSSSTI